MCNVWKVGCRWSDSGAPESSIISIFRRSGIVFVGDDKKFEQVRRGDYLAIADGYNVVSIARAIGDVTPLQKMIEEGLIKVRQTESTIFNIEDRVSFGAGIRVHIVDLPKNEIFQYKRAGQFYSADTKRKKIIDLYNKYSDKPFDIKTAVYSLFGTGVKKPLIDKTRHFVIPVYQRPYSWGEEQIERFIKDIIQNFRESVEGNIIAPMFIGTMQLSAPKFITEREQEYEIIDGQQRLTTICCLYKYLYLKYPILSHNGIKFDWLETRVNNGREDNDLQEMFALRTLADLDKISPDTTNKYIQNIKLIAEIFDHEAETQFCIKADCIEQFVKYISNFLYIVVIETEAGLSKTIQIFNTINTAGLDLGGNDLFKIRLYEYYKSVKCADEDIFDKIGELYELIKEYQDGDILSAGDVLTVYKEYIIAKYGLNVALYDMSTTTFFEYLFDELLGVQHRSKQFGNIQEKGVVLSLEELNNIVDVIKVWEESQFCDCKQMLSWTLLEKSRYYKYTRVAYHILLANPHLKTNIDQLYKLIEPVSKYLFCQSIRYARVVYETSQTMRNIYHELYTNTYSATIALANDKLKEKCGKDILSYIGQEIAHNRIWKDLICVTSNILYETECLQRHVDPKEIRERLNESYDIEHIHATEDNEVIVAGWLQNSIGNLTLLESSINRSIGKKIFAQKKKRYKESCYKFIRDLANIDQWTENEIMDRRDKEIEKIYNYLFKAN